MAKKKEEVKEVDSSYVGCFGERCKPSEIVNWMIRLANDNFKVGRQRWSGNIWGHSGVGKTSLTKSLRNMPVKFKGKEYAGFETVVIPLAQIEEMGDILGCPDDFILVKKGEEQDWVLAKDSVIHYYVSRGYEIVHNRTITKYAPPEWVPTESRPGFIVFDDGNRAVNRILKGLMQLVQDYKTISWNIPEGWTILFTGNPDGQDYLVTTQDKAMITRQRHITMVPDAKEWAVWATENKIDKRGISFVLRYPEMMIGNRTNLRTLTEFFNCIKDVDLDAEKRNVCIDGASLIDDETLSTFLVFCTRDMKMVIEPEMILEQPDKAMTEVQKLMDRSEPRIDIVGVVCDRLYAHVANKDYTLGKGHVENFQKCITSKLIPEDMSHSLMRRLVDLRRPELNKFVLGNKLIMSMVTETLRIN